ncbi:MAG: alpha/beta hydrolase, partial [Deltaproteobacteria bacterium]|nr:alpha/beta hydrolase [Deltaproteobacteria bacterium]
MSVSNVMDEKIEFIANGLSIEGMISRGTGTKGVVITHPHPQYGGDMYNPVVESIGHVYQQKGITTLRFNFRGVGLSDGSYGDGIGEQEDVLAAVACLKKQGVDDIDLAGYSFGAWVNAHIEAGAGPISTLIMVSPPVAFMGFDTDITLPRLGLVVSGSRDE